MLRLTRRSLSRGAPRTRARPARAQSATLEACTPPLKSIERVTELGGPPEARRNQREGAPRLIFFLEVKPQRRSHAPPPPPPPPPPPRGPGAPPRMSLAALAAPQSKREATGAPYPLLPTDPDS